MWCTFRIRVNVLKYLTLTAQVSKVFLFVKKCTSVSKLQVKVNYTYVYMFANQLLT